MKVTITKTRIGGRVRAPSSKSYTIRGLLCAALARGESRILDPLSSDDTFASAGVLRKLGVSIKEDEGFWRVIGGDLHAPTGPLHCGDSAATLRFMTAICASVPGKCVLTAGPSLSRRPVGPLIGALRWLGVNCVAEGNLPPVTVEGRHLARGETSLPGHISSQFVSALLLVSPLARDGMTIRLTTPLESRPYVQMTLECMAKFGVKVDASPDLQRYETKPQSYRPTTYQVEGDWSSASYLLALGAMSEGLTIENLNPASLQGDRVMIDFLGQMGARVDIQDNAVTVKHGGLKALRADLTDCIDLLPTVAVLAGVAEGESVLTGIKRARIKESDRVAAVSDGLKALGIDVTVAEDSLAIRGSKPKRGVIDSRGDHRIAMAFSVLGAAFGGVTVEGAECVNKTFPGYWDILESMGVKVERHE